MVFVIRFLCDAEASRLRAAVTPRLPSAIASGGAGSITANQIARLQFVAGEKGVNDNGRANQRQRDKRKPDFGR